MSLEKKKVTRRQAQKRFNIRWDSPSDARHLWELTDPAQKTPLDFDLTRRNCEYWFKARNFYGRPLNMELRRVNTYVFAREIRPKGTTEELASIEQCGEVRLASAKRELPRRWEKEFLPEIKRHLAAFDSFDARDATTADLLAHFEADLSRLERLWEIHFIVVVPAYYAIEEFSDLYSKTFQPTDSKEAYLLLQGFGNKAIEADEALWTLSRIALSSIIVRRILSEASIGEMFSKLEQSEESRTFLKDLRAYLNEYGKRLYDSDYGSLSWIEDPTAAIMMLRDFMSQPENCSPSARLKRAAEEREHCLASVRKRLESLPEEEARRFEETLKIAQLAYAIRENHNYYIDQASSYRFRRTLLEVGRRLAELGLLSTETDVFYLSFSELMEAVRNFKPVQKELVLKRRAEMEYWKSFKPPTEIGKAESQPFRGKASQAEKTSTVTENSLSGTTVSAGIAEGRACSVKDLREASMKLEKGAVLVTNAIGVEWSGLLAVASALVIEKELNLLSHFAVLAREYGIPALGGVKEAMSKIPDGAKVRVDGNQGIIWILE